MFLVNLNSALIIFFAAAFYLFCPPSRRWMYLLALSSALMLMAAPSALLLCASQTFVAYFMGRWLGRAHRSAGSFWFCILLQLTPLFFYKGSGWLIPLGLSYYTFQILSYLIEIQWRRIDAEPNPWRLASYILFFANKVAGPIERPGMLAQLIRVETPAGEELFKSALWIWMGLFQKFVLADHLGEFVAPVLKFPQNYSGLTTTIAVLFSKYQIFCDFSGISLIALGVAGLFGIRLTPNFARPFAAPTLREFWSRWHISLQTWIRDYVFFPLLSTPVARFGVFLPLVLTFIVFGLWHDWRWTFVAYGALQALLVHLEPGRFFSRLGRPVALALNYAFLISLPGVLFRVSTFGEAWNIWRNMGFDTANWSYFLDLGTMKFSVLAGMLVGHEVLQWAQFRYDIFARAARLPWLVKLLTAILLLVFLILFSKFDSQSTFIYSNF
jgi:alginate O-acetyltransferase complex protein AlgI